MRILLLENNVNDFVTLTNGINLAKQWCATINLPLDFTLQSTATQFRSIPFSNNVASGFTVDPVQVFQVGKTYGEYDVYLLIYDATKITPQPTNPSDGGRGMSMSCQWYSTCPEVFSEFLCHELSHYFFSASGKEDLTHLLVDGTLQTKYPDLYAKFKQGQPKDYYLYLLKQFVTIQPMQTYKYFKPSEIVGLQPSLCQVLDTARGIAGVPFKITSGFRTVAQNQAVGGVSNSAHLKGLAADIAVTDQTRQAILKGFLTCGTPVFLEDAKAHIHADLDSSIHDLHLAIVSELD